MEKITTTEISFSLDEIKELLIKNSNLPVLKKDISIEPIYETIAIPGYDPHDCDYVKNLTGLKITYNR